VKFVNNELKVVVMMNQKGKKETLSIIKKSKSELFIKLLTSILLRGSYLIIPVFWSKAINCISDKDYNSCYCYILISLALAVLYYIMAHLNEKAFYKLYTKLYKEYTEVATIATYQNSMYSLSRFSLGEYTNITNTDVDVIVAFFSNNVIRLVRMFEFVVIFSYFFTIDYSIFIITLAVSAFLLLFYIKSIGSASEYNIIRKRKLDKKTSVIHESFNGIKEIKGFNVFSKINKRISDECGLYLADYSKYNLFLTKTKHTVLGLVELFRYSLMIYGVYLISVGRMELGTLLLIYNYYTQIRDDFEVVGNFIIQYDDFKVSLNRFSKILEFRGRNDDRRYLAKRSYEGKITFIDVLYGNRNDPILKNVSFELEANAINIITGKPGSGKTGVLDLLMQVNRKHNGQILLDGDEIEKINPNLYYNLVSSCRKNPFFFKMSIKDNFNLIDKDFDKAVEICKLLNIDTYISNLEEGYDTIIDPNSHVLSTEIKQLLAIARVLFKNPKIMLFDETLSLLDRSNQELVLNLLERLKLNHTIIIISREKNIVGRGDNIIYMDDNEVIKVVRKDNDDII